MASFSNRDKIKFLKGIFCILAVIGAIQFIIITIIAMFFYPGGYLVFEYTFSYLGTTVAENGAINSISRLLFVLACTLAAILLNPFWVVMPTLFLQKKSIKYLSLLGSFCGIVSSPFLYLLAIIPGDIDFVGHIIATNIFFLLFAAAIIIYSIAILLNTEYENVYGWVGMAFSILIILYPLVFRNIYPIRSLMQRIVVYGFVLWIVYQSTRVWKSVSPKIN
ncbi:MAG: hypothetical protein GF329_07740 [Candidatus Lokiarchaeota archaeon]|nr:hypothetical protein [Candidatus Lokiarchaeota archaeon]